ncbi:MAG: SCO family protein [Chitinophagaceae bacterium]|nr:SCO family protein [Chitinophagaceae bacterium]
MSRKALYALLIAIAIPAVGFLGLSYMGYRNIQMPRQYFYDSVIVKNERGRTSYDTAWHKIKNIKGYNQLGQPVDLDQLSGKVLVVDFFFTHCPSICPRMTRNMKKLQTTFLQSDTLVQFLSFSVDPENDTPERLMWWAKQFDVNPDNWWLITGNKDSIYDFALTEMKASIADVGIDTGFIHTENFFIVDKNRIIRGWYNGTDSLAMNKMVQDVSMLIVEKAKKRSFKEFIRERLFKKEVPPVKM